MNLRGASERGGGAFGAGARQLNHFSAGTKLTLTFVHTIISRSQPSTGPLSHIQGDQKWEWNNAWEAITVGSDLDPLDLVTVRLSPLVGVARK